MAGMGDDAGEVTRETAGEVGAAGVEGVAKEDAGEAPKGDEEAAEEVGVAAEEVGVAAEEVGVAGEEVEATNEEVEAAGVEEGRWRAARTAGKRIISPISRERR